MRDLSLRDALRSSDALVRDVEEGLSTSEAVASLGIDVLGLAILAIRPNPETARALEAETREQLLRESDEAIYARRNAAVKQERAIRENELNTEIAVENKKREIREAQMEAERAVQEKQQQMREEEMTSRIALEEMNKQLVALSADNTRQEADAKAYSVGAVMKVFSGMDAKTLQALATVGMDPSQLIALAFRDLAESADKIGELNITPDLLQRLMQKNPAE